MVKVGIVGLGSLGTRHAVNVMHRTPGAKLLAVCGREQTVNRFTDKHGPVQYTHHSYDEMLKNREIDAILIVTPVSLHAEMVVKAMEAGFHVFVEKPIGLTTEEATRAAAAAEARPDKVFMTGFMRRFDPSYAEAKRKIDAGEIGTPIMFRGYSLDADAAPESAPDRGEKNGAWFPEMLVHDIDLARWFLGGEVETIRTIGGCYKHKAFEKYNDVDNACTLMGFTNRAMATLYTGRTAAHGSHVETEIVGTEGMFRISPVPSRDRVTIYGKGGVRVECVEDYLERFDEAFVREMNEFVNCIAEGRKPAMTPRDSRMVSEAANAAYEAYLSGTLVTLKR